jgi:hypothetical protein
MEDESLECVTDRDTERFFFICRGSSVNGLVHGKVAMSSYSCYLLWKVNFVLNCYR